jgi:uncharacterized membrane protein YgdD (TMEM256/DUF423 family)
MESIDIKKHLIIVGILGATAVIFGAFGAHSLKEAIPAASLLSFKTGVQYQFIHTIMSLLCIVLSLVLKERKFLSVFWLFVIGILLFSGSIYLLTLRTLLPFGEMFYKIIGPITPIGGLFFILGWFKMTYIAIILKS